MAFYLLLAASAVAYVQGACQLPGDAKCFSGTAPIGFVGDACCSGSKCLPWTEEGATFTGTEDWYCQYSDPLPVNSLCGSKQGSCATGLSCVSGVCSAATTTTTTSTTTVTTTTVTTTTPSVTTTTTTPATTSTTTTVTTTTVTTTTAGNPGISHKNILDPSAHWMCDKQGGELCADSKYGLTWTCCSPYECTSSTNRSSICKGTNLPLGATCFSATEGSIGTCASPNICLDNVCTAPSSSCIQPVNGLCYQLETGQTIGSCCTTVDGAASTSICMPFPALNPDPTSDYFCQKALAVGENCDESEHRGFCIGTAFCVNNICTEASATTTSTTTSTSTTSTSTTSTVTLACAASGAACVTFATGATTPCCNGKICNVPDTGVGFKCSA